MTLPGGVHAVQIRFVPAIEAPRKEWFLRGTSADPVIEVVPPRSRLARITSPVDGMVGAIDPDIPQELQRVPITVEGATTDLFVRLDDAVIGQGGEAILWTPSPGRHRVMLEDGSGRAMDQAVVTVR